MLENSLFYFYKSRLSYWNLIGKFMWRKILFAVTLNIFAIVFMLYLKPKIQFINLNGGRGYFIIYIIILVTLSVSIALIILKPSVAFAEKKYGARFQSYQWELFLCAFIKAYLLKHIYINNERYELNENNKKTEEPFNFLIGRLEKQLEQKRKGSFLNIYLTSSTITLTIFIPVWAAFNTWLIRDNNDITSSIHYVIYVPVTTLGLLVFWKATIWRGFLKGFLEGIFERDLTKISMLIEKLELIKFSIENPHYCKEIDEYLINNNQAIASMIKDFDKQYIHYHPDALERALRQWKQERKKNKEIKSTSEDDVSN
ncbi:hypothetical protein ABE078_28485 [Priestia megaterium]